MLFEQGRVEVFNMTGKSHDCGDKSGYIKAFVEYGMRNKILGAEFITNIKKLVKDQ